MYWRPQCLQYQGFMWRVLCSQTLSCYTQSSLLSGLDHMENSWLAGHLNSWCFSLSFLKRFPEFSCMFQYVHGWVITALMESCISVKVIGVQKNISGPLTKWSMSSVILASMMMSLMAHNWMNFKETAILARITDDMDRLVIEIWLNTGGNMNSDALKTVPHWS